MRRRRRSPASPFWEYAIDKLRVIPIAIAVIVGGIVFAAAQETDRYSAAAAEIDHVAPRSPADVAPGDIVIVNGRVHSDFKPTPSSNEPGFGNVFKVRRVLERETSGWSGKRRNTTWKDAGSFTWTAPYATLGPWTIDATALAGADSGARSAVPMVEFTPSIQSNAGDIEVRDSFIYYASTRGKYRLSYQVWESDRPYSVVATVGPNRILGPVDLGRWHQRITIFTPGELNDAAVSRKNMLLRKGTILAALLFTTIMFWWGLGVIYDEMLLRAKVLVTAIAVGPLAITIASPIIAMPTILSAPLAAAGIGLLLVGLFLFAIYWFIRIILGLY